MVRISVLDETSGNLYNIEVDDGANIATIKQQVEGASRILSAQQLLLKDGQELTQDAAKISELNIRDDDLLMLRRKAAPTAAVASSGAAAGSAPRSSGFNPFAQQPMQQRDITTMTPQQFLEHIRTDRVLLERLRQAQPMLLDAINRGDANLVYRAFEPIIAQEKAKRREEELYRRLEQNPFDVEAQREIEEQIRLKQVQENYENAMEEMPEAFGSVVMLYIDCKINGIACKAFVDSGAQTSVCSKSFAERTGLLRLLDSRYSGEARGVGRAKILGRVHLTLMQINQSFFPVSLTVLEQEGMDFLLGLDMLRRHQCTIDLKDNCLRIGTEQARFLSEHELKDILSRENVFSDDGPLSPSGHLHAPNFSGGASSSGAASASGASAAAAAAPSSPAPVAVAPPSPARPAVAPQQSPAVSTPPRASPVPSPAAAGVGQRQMPGGFADENKISQIMSLGFSREQAILALTAARGNVDIAASMLFGG